MVIVNYLLLITLSVALTFLFSFLLKKDRSKFLKIISLSLALVFFFRFEWDKEAIGSVRGLNMYSPLDSMFGTAISAILIWFTYAVVLFFVLYPFFKVNNIKTFLKYFAPIILILDIVFFKEYCIGIMGAKAFSEITVWLILITVELSMMIAYFVVEFANKEWLQTSKKEIGILFLTLIPILISAMPVWGPQVLLGYGPSHLILQDLTEEHRISMYICLIIPIVIYKVLKNKNMEVKRFTLLYLSLATMCAYCYKFKFDIYLEPVSWPLHLCNTAMFVLPICFIFKLDKLFYFTVFINVFGAFIAMAMPNYTVENIYDISTVTFMLNHSIAFFMPALAVMLGLYDRPNFKLFKYSLVAFAVYFSIIAFLNGLLQNYGNVDFFFLNSDFVVSKLGDWAENLRNYTWTWHIKDLTLVFYPLYHTLFFLCYVLLSLGMWFLYEQMFAMQDYGYELAHKKEKRKMEKIILKESLAGRSIEEPMNEKGKDCFELINFSKKYGLSKRYAVKGVNLKVNAGEIFGFLGPNGAGKSTIIKSLVGIQSITDGRIEVCGYDLQKQAVQAKKQMGYVPDHYALYENLTGREYINYIADLYGVKKTERDERIKKYVEIFQLEEAFDNQMKTYSHGMKQKMTIMAALVHNPKVWILDEPLTGLDPTSIFQVKECMKAHAAAGNIVFFSSHIIDVVEKLCTRIAIIKKGNILCDEKVSTLKKKKIDLEQFYLDHIKD
ncbi:MAG: ATP-binding cassette domain-containing protein [Erysipelotrichaceae bacterium]|nr:ATP-binding cassette domain-containing protein [Erysipelotrichaceae bacterium]